MNVNVSVKLLKQIAAEGDEFMPSKFEWTSTKDLERAGLIEEAFFGGGGAITYRITAKGRRLLKAEGEPSLQRMILRDLPITREAFIQLAYGKEEPAEWTPEHESNLPAELQDWSVFEKKRKSRRRTSK
jgi:DNA-binding PadR family transcriptional regulator